MDFNFLVDNLTAVMLIVVTTIGMLVHVYSIGYMAHDPGRWRFFAYLNLFMFSMLLLVLAANYLVRVRGLGAGGPVLLPAHRLLVPQARQPALANKKAFLTNRVGDFGFALGIMAIWTTIGTLNFTEVFALLPEKLLDGEIEPWMMTASACCCSWARWARAPSSRSTSGCRTRWRAPPRCRALIHAATMVNAGVYLIARTSPIMAYAPGGACSIVACIGTFTAILAASIALTQNDIKRVLAYSTLSQLGYMFLALGVGAWVAAIFHLVTHGFFKGLLFLGSGSVIHAVHEEQDMNRMGGLWRKDPDHPLDDAHRRPRASRASRLLAGFFSKDEILGEAFKFGLRVGALSVVGVHRGRHDRVLHVPADGQDVLRREPRRPRGGAPDPRIALVDDRAAHPAGHPARRSSACHRPRLAARRRRRSSTGWSRCSTRPRRRWASRSTARSSVAGIDGGAHPRASVAGRLARAWPPASALRSAAAAVGPETVARSTDRCRVARSCTGARSPSGTSMTSTTCCS